MTSLSLLDYRRQTFSLYDAIRRETEPAAGHRLWVKGRNDLFAHHPDSPLQADHRQGFAGLTVAKYDPRFRVEARIEAATGGSAQLELPTGDDTVATLRRLGSVRFELPGGAASLDVWWLTGYGGGVFVPFREVPPGPDTYGGGRYLLDTVKGADLGSTGDTLVLDFNFAYHPSCAYDPAWVCPLAPPGNVMRQAVPVGERYVGPWAGGDASS